MKHNRLLRIFCRIGLLLLYLYSSSEVRAQNRIIDSIYRLVRAKSTPLNQKFEYYNYLCNTTRTGDYSNVAKKITFEYLTLSRLSKNDLEQVKANSHFCLLYNIKGDYDSALYYTNQVKDIARRNNNPTIKIYLAVDLCEQAYSFLEYEKIISICTNTIPLLSLSNDFNAKLRIYFNLYTVYKEWKNSSKAQFYALKMAECADLSDEKTFRSVAYISVAESYEQEYLRLKKTELLDSAFYFSNKSLSLYLTNPDELSNYSYAYSNINMAKLLLNYKYKGNSSVENEINKYIQTGIDYSKKSEDTHLLMADALILKSTLAYSHHNKMQEEHFLLEALDTCKQEDPLDYSYVIDVYGRLAKFYKKSGQFEKAFECQNEMLAWKDRQFGQMEKNVTTRYETLMQLELNERKLKEIEIKAESRRRQNYLLIGLFFLLLIVAFFIVKSIRLRLQVSLANQRQLLAEKHEKDLQIKLEKEETQRLKTEQEFLAFQQQRLQTEVVANRLHLQHKNEVLQQIKDKIDSEKSINIDKLLREESFVDKDFESAVFEIEEVHPNFFKSLNDKSLQKLTPLDLKYCAYVYLGMSAKQIGNLLNVESKSVRMTKYRLKLKIGFPSDITLEDYLQSIAN